MAGDLVAQRYRLGRQLGVGGMGVVCEATHEGTGRKVALKIIRNIGALGEERTAWLARFRREARAAGALDTPHIIQVFDAGTDEQSGEPFIAMELLTGSDLSRLLKDLGALPPVVALKVVGQACRALELAHAAGVIHRDIKPGNVFLAEARDGEVIVKLVDFGIAKVVSEEATGPEHAELTQTGSLLGTPTYMSPEQAKGLKNIDFRADLWALAVVLYKAVTNRVPHPKREGLGQLIVTICTEPAPPVQDFAPWVPPEIVSILDRALQLEIERRFQSAAEFRAAIEAAIGTDLRLTREEVRGLTEAERAVVAPRHISQFPPPVRAERKSDVGVEESRTQPGVVHPADWANPARRARWPWVVLTAAAALGVGLFWARMHPQNAPAATREIEVARPRPSASIAESKPAETSTRTVTVGISPADADVEVDGKPVKTENGKFSVTGELGTTHRVALKLDGRESAREVAITTSGAVPENLVLDAAPATKAQTAARKPEPRSPKSTTDTQAKPPDKEPAKPAPAKSGVGVVKVFE